MTTIPTREQIKTKLAIMHEKSEEIVGKNLPSMQAGDLLYVQMGVFALKNSDGELELYSAALWQQINEIYNVNLVSSETGYELLLNISGSYIEREMNRLILKKSKHKHRPFIKKMKAFFKEKN